MFYTSPEVVELRLSSPNSEYFHAVPDIGCGCFLLGHGHFQRERRVVAPPLLLSE
jgi:hypothetical protein